VSRGFEQISDDQRLDGGESICSLSGGLVKIGCLYFSILIIRLQPIITVRLNRKVT
jgi:hypothetical protein